MCIILRSFLIYSINNLILLNFIQAAPTLPLSSPQAKNVSKPRKRPAATEGIITMLNLLGSARIGYCSVEILSLSAVPLGK